MELKIEIICKNFEQKTINNQKICVNEQTEEYYIIPLNKSYDLEYDDEICKLTFKNQLLWLKYSNHQKEILLKEYNFNECVVVKSEDILDIYVKIIDCSNCFRKNVWQSNNNVSLNKRYLGKHMLILPIIEDMIDINEFGEGIKEYQIELITNEVLLKEVKDRGNNNGYVVITNNVVLNNEALFVRLFEDDVESFLE